MRFNPHPTLGTITPMQPRIIFYGPLPILEVAGKQYALPKPEADVLLIRQGERGPDVRWNGQPLRPVVALLDEEE